MIHVEQTRLTSRPIEEVFRYVANFATTAEYDPGVIRAVQTSNGEVGEGTTFDVESLFFGVNLPLEYVIEELEPPDGGTARVALRGSGLTARAHDDIRFESTVSGGTVVQWRLDLHLLGPGALWEPVMAPIARRIGRHALDGLAARLRDPRPLSDQGRRDA